MALPCVRDDGAEVRGILPLFVPLGLRNGHREGFDGLEGFFWKPVQKLRL